MPYERPLPAELVKFLDASPPTNKTIPKGQELMHSLHFTAETSSNGLVERDFAVREITGGLWSPASGTDRAPLVLMGHGGGQHRKAPAMVGRAPHCDQLRFHRRDHRCARTRGRPRTAHDEQEIAAMQHARAAGQPVGPIVVRYNAHLAERAVPEWQATLILRMP